MKIKDLFVKDIFRSINGVVKADQKDEAIIFQELDEYVVTRELDKHIRKFYTSYLKSKDNVGDPNISGQTGVWISGFFGSGKSHFIKILSYLLYNQEIRNPVAGDMRHAVDFLKDKIADPMLFADIKRATDSNTDVILFNIDSKADAKEGRSAILSVFMRVLNELQGLSGDPHIAELERHLNKKDKLELFNETFKKIAGEEWNDNRDAYLLMQDEIVETLSQVLGMTQETARDWFNKAEENCHLSVESFAKCVKDYLDSKGKSHRLIFLVDEVGQFIGKDGHLMLSLQTITEHLGQICLGRAWVVVTSQEDIDKVLGEIKASEANDFSKIQGRFTTRISLSSSNTDEVIQARLLDKTVTAQQELEELFHSKGDILKSQLSFTQDSATMKTFKSAEDFAATYPFPPYQFNLLQKIFEQIRRVGVTGLHLARGERSMLDAFQTAAQSVSDKEVGALVPLYSFYPSIESFLEGIIKSVIDKAADNPGLDKPFDINMLQTLFLIRYIDSIKPNVDNLVTLFIEQVDADRMVIKKKIQESLQRLEKETLINRSGDLYYFLTNEERDVSREIKYVEISKNEEIKTLSELIFEDIFKGNDKHKYAVNKRDYGYNRFCDGQPYKLKSENEISAEVITPVSDDYDSYTAAKIFLRSLEDQGRFLIKLDDTDEIGRELRIYLQTEKYIRNKSGAEAAESLKKILSDRAAENRNRKNKIIEILNKLIISAEFYAKGSKFETKASTLSAIIQEGMDYLIRNIYTKLCHLETLSPDPIAEIKAVLISSDITQQNLDIAGAEPVVNFNAIREILEHINLMNDKNNKIVLSDLITRFSKNPWGWHEWEIALLIAKIFKAGEINLKIDGAALEPKEAVSPLTKSGQWKQIVIIKRKKTASEDIASASQLAKELFGILGPDGEEPLYNFLISELKKWEQQLSANKPLADTRKYPGKKEIDEELFSLGKILSIKDTFEFIKKFIEQKDILRNIADDFTDINGFYTTQKPTWDRLLTALELFKPNKAILDENPDSYQAYNRMEEIFSAESPYSMMKEVDTLIKKVKAINDSALNLEKETAEVSISEIISKAGKYFKKLGADSNTVTKALKPVNEILEKIKQDTSIPNIRFLMDKAAQEIGNAYSLVEASVAKADKPLKSIKEIKPASISRKTYIETEEDIEEYIAALRKQLLEAVKGNNRIRLK